MDALVIDSGAENAMAFLNKSGFMDTSSGEVRVAARNCVVAVYKNIGNSVKPFLKGLRKKQVPSSAVNLFTFGIAWCGYR